MARLIPTLIVFFYFSLLLSSSHAGTPVTSTEDEVTKIPSAAFNEEDVSDLKPLIVLPTDNQLKSDAVSLVNGDKNQLQSGKFTGEFQDMDIPGMKSFDDGEKKLEEFHPTENWRPMNHHFNRMRPIRCRHHHGPRFGGEGAQIRPRMPFWKEVGDEHHNHGHHHGGIFSTRRFDGPRLHEMDPARFAGVDGDGRMISEFKHPHFFFRRHHHHHHHHHHDDDEDRFHHGEEGEMEEREHHRHRRGHGFWKTIRKILGPF